MYNRKGKETMKIYIKLLQMNSIRVGSPNLPGKDLATFPSSVPDIGDMTQLSIYLLIKRMEEIIKKHPKVTTQVQKKYEEIKKTINNKFLTDNVREEILNICQKSQRTYAILLRFINKTKINRNPQKFKITTDLSQNPLDLHHRTTFVIHEFTHQTQASYMTSIPELLKIIESSVLNSPDFFETPLAPKNPYTNIPLATETLYILFYQLYKINYNIPTILIKYFKYNFNLKLFRINCQPEIRELYIKRFVLNGTTKELHEEILIMIKERFYIRRDRRIRIHKNFPKSELIEIMKPYLYLYLIECYYIFDTDKQRQAEKALNEIIRVFITYNPIFGRSCIKISKPTIFRRVVEPPATQKIDSKSSIQFGHPASHNVGTNETLTRDPDQKPPPKPPTIKEIYYEKKHPKLSMNEIDKIFINPEILKNRTFHIQTEESSDSMSNLSYDSDESGDDDEDDDTTIININRMGGYP